MEIANPTAGTFPVGKHRGHLLEEAAEDRSYCCWLFDQPRFRREHPAQYEVLRDLVGINDFMREARISNYRASKEASDGFAIQLALPKRG